MNFDLDESLEVLARTPSTFRSLLSGLSDAWITADEGPQTFTPFDNLGHVIQGERADWMTRARIIRAQGADRRFQPFDRTAHERDSKEKTVAMLLDELEALRARNLAELRSWNLSADQLALEGEHPAFGPVTLEQLLAAWVVHDLGHIVQTTRVMAKRYRDDVGPWRKYLPILDR